MAMNHLEAPRVKNTWTLAQDAGMQWLRHVIGTSPRGSDAPILRYPGLVVDTHVVSNVMGGAQIGMDEVITAVLRPLDGSPATSITFRDRPFEIEVGHRVVFFARRDRVEGLANLSTQQLYSRMPCPNLSPVYALGLGAGLCALAGFGLHRIFALPASILIAEWIDALAAWRASARRERWFNELLRDELSS